MAFGATSRWALPYPDDDESVDVPRDVQALAEALDDVAKDTYGLIANRPVSTAPSPGKSGRYYWATDESILYRDHGTGWTPLNAKATIQHPLTFTLPSDQPWPDAGVEVGRFPVKLASGQTSLIPVVTHSIASGSGTVMKLQRSTDDCANWSDVTGYTAITPATTGATTDAADQAMDEDDWGRLLMVTKGTGRGGAVAAFLREAA